MKNIYRLPETTTPENLECRFFTDSATFLTFGTKTLMAGYYYNGRNANSYYPSEVLHIHACNNDGFCWDHYCYPRFHILYAYHHIFLR